MCLACLFVSESKIMQNLKTRIQLNLSMSVKNNQWFTVCGVIVQVIFSKLQSSADAVIFIG